MNLLGSRESLWLRVAGASGWGVAWALVLASSLPWLIPETWDGIISKFFLRVGWVIAIGSLFLLQSKLRYVGLCIIVLWATFLGMSRLARWDFAMPGGYQELEGIISEPWINRGFRQHSHLSVFSPSTMKGLSIPLSVPSDGEAPPLPGTPVRFRADMRSTQSGPGFLAERPLWRARNEKRQRQVTLSSALIMESLAPPEPSLLLRFRCWMMARFQSLPIKSGTARDIWGALTLGIHPINDDVTNSFAESGILHLLVVSGLQITLVMATVEALLRKILKRGSGIGAILCGLAFSALVGFTAPIWRGLLMGFAWVFGRAFGWKIPPALSLHLALLVWLVLNPATGCAPGFLLGWWALLGLVWVTEPLQGLISPIFGRWSVWIARVSAPWATTMPLLAILNGGIPAWGIITNLVVLPFVWILLPLCLFLTIVPIPPLVVLTAEVLDFLTVGLVPIFARIMPMATGILWPWILLVLGWLLLAQFKATFKKSRALTTGLLATSIGLIAYGGTGRSVKTLTLGVPDIGQGDALLLRVPNGDATLIDTGPTPWSARRLVRIMSRMGVREPVHLIITHPHSDHAGGSATLTRLWPTASLSIPTVANPSHVWAEFISDRNIESANVIVRGDSWFRGSTRFDVCWPPKPLRLPDPNMLSAVLRVRWNEHEIWFMGDALAIQERDLIDLGDPEPWDGYRLLKAGHHGGATATSAEWITALKPQTVIFTAEHPNRFGFPTLQVLQRVEDSGAEILVTGLSKGFTLKANEKDWIVYPHVTK
ncbi:MAG: ComEC/Rec2 family competence protein [Holophagaceae bacterium]|nr:ComEC/Rec2 family competence protein [Holophagaceae bacterium]